VEGAADASEDVAFVRYLAADTLSRGQYAAAAACLKRLTALAPADAGAWRQLGAAAGRLGQWGTAAEAHEKAGDLLLSRAGGKEEKSSSSGAGGGAAAEAGAEFVAAAVAHLNAASIPSAGSASGSRGDARTAAAISSAKLAHVGRGLELLHKAVSKAGVSDSAIWYYVCMGRLATGQLPAALEAAQRSWEHSQRLHAAGDGGDSGGGGGGEATLASDAARLAKPLAALCERLSAEGLGAGENAQLLRTAELAVQAGLAAGAEARGALRDALERAAEEEEVRQGAGSDGSSQLRELAGSLL
jgi:hypothetical protein